MAERRRNRAKRKMPVILVVNKNSINFQFDVYWVQLPNTFATFKTVTKRKRHPRRIEINNPHQPQNWIYGHHEATISLLLLIWLVQPEIFDWFVDVIWGIEIDVLRIGLDSWLTGEYVLAHTWNAISRKMKLTNQSLLRSELLPAFFFGSHLMALIRCLLPERRFCYHIKLSAESHFKGEPHRRHINALTELHFPCGWWPIYRGRNKEWQRQKLHQLLIRFRGLCHCRNTANILHCQSESTLSLLAKMKSKAEKRKRIEIGGESIRKMNGKWCELFIDASNIQKRRAHTHFSHARGKIVFYLFNRKKCGLNSTRFSNLRGFGDI